jgi:hypothetical protein
MDSAILRSIRRGCFIAALGTVSIVLSTNPSLARIFVGIGVPLYGPVYVPPPVYYPPPPVYYPPPPVYYTPQPAYSPAAPAYSPGPSGAGQACYAGPYVCPMDRPVAPGGTCYCIGNGGQRVGGRAN